MGCGEILQDIIQSSLNPMGTGSVNYITADISTIDALIGTIPANRMIQRIHIDILEDYDIPVFITIGDDISWARLWRFGNSLMSSQIYTKFSDYRYSTPTKIYWRFESTPTTGSAKITIHFS